MVTRGQRVWVETLLVARVGTFLDYQGAECYGGLNLARVTLDDTPGQVVQVARQQVRTAQCPA